MGTQPLGLAGAGLWPAVRRAMKIENTNATRSAGACVFDLHSHASAQRAAGEPAYPGVHCLPHRRFLLRGLRGLLVRPRVQRDSESC